MFTGARRRWVATIMALALASGIPAAAGHAAATADRTVATVGTSLIYGDNLAAARQQAIRSGSFTAVDKVVAELLPEGILARFFETLNQGVYNSAEAFVPNYKVLTEWHAENRYRVLLVCTVAVEQIREQLARIGVPLNEAALPSVLVMMAERNFPDDPPQFWWGDDYLFARAASETALAGVLAESGFPLVGHDAPGPPSDSGSPPPGADPAPADVALMGKRFNAEVVVYGQAVAHASPNTMVGQTLSFNGHVQARALQVDTGQLLAEVERSAVVVADDEITGGQNAIAAAGKLAGEELARRLAVAWQRAGAELRTVTVLVKGTQPLANFVRFRQMLGELPGVEQVQAKELAATEATVQMRVKGELGRLAEAMLQQTFDTFRINIVEVGEDRISVELIPL